MLRDEIAKILFDTEEWNQDFNEWKEEPKHYFQYQSLLNIADQILAIKLEGKTVEVIDETKFPMYRYTCPRGHGSWSEKCINNVGFCKVCDKAVDDYNVMLKEKKYNWPVSFHSKLRGTIIEKGGEYRTTRPATLGDMEEK